MKQGLRRTTARSTLFGSGADNGDHDVRPDVVELSRGRGRSEWRSVSATVTVKNVDTGLARTTQTSADGSYLS
jgi:hypothetical protein